MRAMDCTTIHALVSSFSLIRDCAPVREGWLMLSTAFQYPDGSYIDLYVRTEPDGQHTLSDLGNTAAWLLDAQVDWSATPNRKNFMQDVCTALDVTEHNGALQLVLPPDPGTVAEGLMRLGQACLRLADLLFTKPARSERVVRAVQPADSQDREQRLDRGEAGAGPAMRLIAELTPGLSAIQVIQLMAELEATEQVELAAARAMSHLIADLEAGRHQEQIDPRPTPEEIATTKAFAKGQRLAHERAAEMARWMRQRLQAVALSPSPTLARHALPAVTPARPLPSMRPLRPRRR